MAPMIRNENAYFIDYSRIIFIYEIKEKRWYAAYREDDY